MKRELPRTGAKRLPWKSVRGGITAPQGFLASGVAAGIKKAGLDLAVLFSSQPASAAAVFTTNRVQAAPVALTRKHLQSSRGHIRAALVNSGCANACTGDEGLRDAATTVDSLASLLGIPASQVAVASTGVIGEPLPVRKMLSGIAAAVSALSSRGGACAMRAIMTTDTREKTFAVEGRIGGKIVRIGGMAKGSGMIHPNLATMLAILTTDVQMPPSQLKSILRRVVDRTFNCVTVDGDTSTNDTVLIIANGASSGRVDGRWAAHFERGLERVCEELSKRIAADGEGATKLVEITVRGAPTFQAARTVAKTVAHSPLVKTALYGEELNWGRILCAAGYSGVPFNPGKITLTIAGIPIFRDGAGVTASRARAERALKAKEVRIGIDLAEGKHGARVWTCDLSREYVDINASYIS